MERGMDRIALDCVCFDRWMRLTNWLHTFVFVSLFYYCYFFDADVSTLDRAQRWTESSRRRLFYSRGVTKASILG